MVYVLTLLLVSGGTEQTPRTIRGDSTLPRGQKPSCSALICNLRGPSQSGNTLCLHSEDRWDNIVLNILDCPQSPGSKDTIRTAVWPRPMTSQPPILTRLWEVSSLCEYSA
ncbi:Calcium-binding carrier protein Aralar1 [Fusarium oxysporum f. sp. albedinis]|nr:Calcium-binding carrier protein Aralar1 [Fusarium oxysporum f. sp. albedinis]